MIDAKSPQPSVLLDVQMHAVPAVYRTEVVRHAERFLQLKPAWDSLWQRSVTGGVYQSFDNCRHMWEAIASPTGRKLFCFVGWQGDRAVAIWPMTMVRQYAWRCIRPLEASGAEYTDMLLDPDLDARPWIDSALDVIRRQAGCDVMILPYVKTSTALREALALLSQNAIVEHEAGVCVNLRHETDWQSYYNSLSPTLRKKNRAFRRKIEKVGEIKLAVVPAGDPRCPDLIDWMLAQKRIWSERMGKSGPWLSSPHYREFLVRLLSDPNAIPKPFLFTLTAGDILLGVKLQSAGKSLCEALVAAFNADYEKISPGVVLDEFCVQWAFEQKLDCDFGNGLERNKLFWSRHESVETATFTVPLSLWGRSYLAARNWARKRRAKPPAQNNAEATEENDTTAGG